MSDRIAGEVKLFLNIKECCYNPHSPFPLRKREGYRDRTPLHSPLSRSRERDRVRGLAPAGACESNACGRNIDRKCGDVSKAGESILRGAREALAFARGARARFVVHVPESVDVKAIRRRLGLSQRRFAERFGFKLDAVQNWEQGRRRPEGAARAFLRVIEREPEAVERALAPKQRKSRMPSTAVAK